MTKYSSLPVITIFLIFILCSCSPYVNPSNTGEQSGSPSTQVNSTTSPDDSVSASRRIDLANTDELEKFLKETKYDKSRDIYGNISGEKYFRLENDKFKQSLRGITITEGSMSFVYMDIDKPDMYRQNTVSFIWYRNFDDGKAFLANLFKEGLTYEEIEYKGTLYLYRKSVAPAGPKGEDIEVCQVAHWAQGNDCFSCSFPLSYSKEEFLDYCKAVSKKIE